jgi:S-DNA-T family DNA segregation ATPase FtsK/SpoIIIE
MAKRKNKNKNRKPSNSLKNFFSDERLKLVLGLIFTGFAIFLSLAFISYFFTWQADQSFENQEVFSSVDVQVDNWSGKTGAYLAFVFITKWFGIAAFFVPFLFFIIGFRLFKIRLLPLRRTIRISILAAIILSVLLGFLFEDTNGYLGSGLGGRHGYFISEWLVAFAGSVGTSLLLVVSIAAFLIFSIPNLHNRLKGLLHPEMLSESSDEKEQYEDEFTDVKSPAETSDETVFETEFAQHTNEDRELGNDFTVEPYKTEEPVDQNNESTPQKSEASSEDDVEMEIGEQKKEETLNKNLHEDYDPKRDLSNYKFPTIDLLEKHDSGEVSVSNEELISNKNKIVETLANYKIQIDKIKATIGPTVTLYEIVPAPGVRISKIKNLEDDIALSLAALGIRIIAPMPGKGTIGIEVPNQNPEVVSMRSIISSRRFQETKFELPVAIGKTITNETFTFDLTKMPHLLVAGATGQGKSVGLNAIITSLLYKKHPAELNLVMVDPKKVELTLYSKIERHFLAKLPDAEEAIITDTQKVINTLNSLCIEMDERYDLLKAAFVRNIKEYNQKFIARKLNPQNGHRFLPYTVVIIDEFADLIMTAGKEIETPIARLAQLARAVGIHLIIATQRPTTNIITGVIKANFPARIAFRVTSGVDSKTILDSTGANQLIGRGDMLMSTGSDLVRIQCAFIDIPELEKITDHIGGQQGYTSAALLPEYSDDGNSGGTDVDLDKRDDLFEDAARLVVMNQQGSTSLIQRKFSIGYNRAGRIIDQMEAAGIVGPFEGSKARQVLFPDEYTLEQFLNELNK